MSEYFIGLMSGTSADGIDAVLMEFTPAPRILATHFTAYPESVRAKVQRLAAGRHQVDAVDELGGLDSELGQLFAAAALALMDGAKVARTKIRAIGSHGQTVRHRPRAAHPFSLQIADPNIIAARTGLTVVGDFRRRDVALGGQGAPLLPAFHRVAFADQSEDRVVANIGGIANITLLPAGGTVSGFDTGPGNVLLDHWSREHLGQPYDRDGDFAAGGKLQPELLKALLADGYFSEPPPKSTGPEHFNPAWLAQALGDKPLPAADVAATLTELTAHSIAACVLRQAPAAHKLFVCGGGVHNDELMRRLAANLPKAKVESTEVLGVHPDWVEAAGFAWLARETLAGRPGNLPSVTGAAQASVVGAIYPA